MPDTIADFRANYIYQQPWPTGLKIVLKMMDIGSLTIAIAPISLVQPMTISNGTWIRGLFNMKNDPKEYENLWDSPKYQSIKYEMMKKSFDQTVLSMDTGPARLGRY